MKTVKNLDEATAHFENSLQPILCEKEGEQPIEATTLEQAREYYGFIAPEEPVQIPATGSDASQQDTGLPGTEGANAEGNPGATEGGTQNEGAGALVD